MCGGECGGLYLCVVALSLDFVEVTSGLTLCT